MLVDLGAFKSIGLRVNIDFDDVSNCQVLDSCAFVSAKWEIIIVYDAAIPHVTYETIFHRESTFFDFQLVELFGVETT